MILPKLLYFIFSKNAIGNVQIRIYNGLYGKIRIILTHTIEDNITKQRTIKPRPFLAIFQNFTKVYILVHSLDYLSVNLLTYSSGATLSGFFLIASITSATASGVVHLSA